jgi:hypothetical protein
MADERIAVGDHVRLASEGISDIHPRATSADVGPHTSPFLVAAFNKDTEVATLSRQGQVFGEYPVSALVKVEEPIDNTKPKPPEPEAPAPQAHKPAAMPHPTRSAPFSQKK